MNFMAVSSLYKGKKYNRDGSERKDFLSINKRGKPLGQGLEIGDTMIRVPYAFSRLVKPL